MNLTVRVKNPVFWAQILIGAVGTMLAYAGLTASDLTTWLGLWEIIKGTFSNPYCLFLVACNIWNALNDPTTKGLGDSSSALTYTEPKKE